LSYKGIVVQKDTALYRGNNTYSSVQRLLKLCAEISEQKYQTEKAALQMFVVTYTSAQSTQCTDTSLRSPQQVTYTMKSRNHSPNENGKEFN